jgi:photosystem II stability/assembly factor-like uncharacterized protein
MLMTVLFSGQAFAQWQVIASGTTDSLTAITWVNDRFLVAGSGLTFLRSMDDGLSFSATTGYAPGFDGSPLNHLSFHDSLVGYGTSTMNCCSFQSTNDGGATWVTTFPAYDGVQMRVTLDAAHQVVFKSGAGVQFDTNGLLLFEPDAVIYADPDSVCPVPDSGNCVLSVVGTDTTYSTGSYGWTLTSNDRGASIQSGTFPYASYIYSAHRVNDTTVSYIDFGPTVRISHDRGVSWQRRSDLPITLGLISPAFRMRDAAYGIFADDNGQLRITNDSAMTWTPIPVPTNVTLNDLLFVEDDFVLAVGDNGTILSSSDGGSTWEVEESGTTERLHAITTSGTATIAIGTNGTILRRFPAHAGLALPTAYSDARVPEFKLFPNPVPDVLHILDLDHDDTNATLFTVRDALGRQQAVPPMRIMNGSWSVDISNLAQGWYTLHGDQGELTWKRAFLIVR